MNVSADSQVALKSCCAALYETEWARLLLGESFHPGGLKLTEHLGRTIGLEPGRRVLDVAAGNGASARILAERFGCTIAAVDLSAGNTAAARRLAAPLPGVHAVTGDGEQLPFGDGSMDAVICECAYCAFPNKALAAREFTRVLRPGGALGVSDVTVKGTLPGSLQTLLAWAACIADAQTTEQYVQQFEDAGLRVVRVEDHSTSLRSLIRSIQGKLLGVEVVAKLRKMAAADELLQEAKALAQNASGAVESGQLGYHMFVAVKPAHDQLPNAPLIPARQHPAPPPERPLSR